MSQVKGKDELEIEQNCDEMGTIKLSELKRLYSKINAIKN